MTKPSRTVSGILVATLLVFLWVARPEAQAVVAAQIQAFWTLLKAGGTDAVSNITYAFTNAAIIANGYLSFGTLRGASGYGIRDNAGTIEIKNSGGNWAAPAGGAGPNATYLVQTASGAPANAQIMGSLGTGLVFNTTITGVQSIYGGTSCTNQFPRSLSGSGAATCATVNLASDITGLLPSTSIPALAGDVNVTAGFNGTTLATVNANVGAFGSTTSIATFTVNGKGLITTAANVTPQLTITSTYFSSLSGANLTGIPTTAFTGTIQAANFPALTGDVTSAGGSLATSVVKIGGNNVTLGGALTFSGAFATTITVTGGTSVTLPTSGTLISTTITSLPSLTTIGTIGTGVWQGTVVGPTYGGTGVNNGTSTITLGGNFATSGASAVTLTTSGATNVTLPTSGTLIAAPVPVASGGTNLTSYTTGDLLYASGATTLSKLADVAAGVLCAGGVGVAPAYCQNPTLTSPTTTSLTFGSGVKANSGTPSLSSGFGASPGLVFGNSFSFEWNVGTGGAATTGTITLGTTAAHGWICSSVDITTQSTTVFLTKQTTSTTTTASFTNYNTAGAAAAWVASDHLLIRCTEY